VVALSCCTTGERVLRGIVARGAACLSSQSRWPWEVQRRENGLQAPNVHRNREKRGQYPTGQGAQPALETHVPQRAPGDP